MGLQGTLVFLTNFNAVWPFIQKPIICFAGKQIDWFLYEMQHWTEKISQPAFTCSKLTIETLEQDVKYVQS